MVTNDDLIASGRSSPGNILICSRALELLFIVRIVFSNNCLSVPFKYFSVNSLLTINDFSSIIEIIESVIFSLVPLGISNSIETLSLATDGNIVTPITPPPMAPKVKINKATKIPKESNLKFKTKVIAGVYILSLKKFMKLSPALLMILILEKNCFIFEGFSSTTGFLNAFECAKCAGSIINASTNETTKVSITITDTSLKNSPILLSKNKNNENAKSVVIIAETTGGITSIVPSIAASTGDFPFS